jgi:large subunit ribosomal protein L18e
VAATRKGNPALNRLLTDLYRLSAEQQVALWRDVAKRLARSQRNRSEVNLSRVNRYAKDGDVVLVPGTLLASGTLTKKVTVAAFRASAQARRKVEAAGGETLTIDDLARRNPKGSGVRILG